tara:strand:- start:2397 stop:2990 length:594 start_codon:yes stop_codon:yes gene_type:complete
MHPKLIARIISLRDISSVVDVRDNQHPPSDRVLEHPAPTNRHHDEYRFCHPRNPRTRISRATFEEIKRTLNKWTPDNAPEKALSREVILTPENSASILKKCLVHGEEDLSDFTLILAFEQGLFVNGRWSFCYKVVLYDTKNHVFLLRTGGNKENARLWGYTKEIDVHSYDPEWFVDRSTLLAQAKFWLRLREIINAI